MKSNIKALLGTTALALIVSGMAAAPAQAGTIILEGSDAIGFHCNAGGDVGACTYRDQVWTAIGGVDARPIAVIGIDGTFGNVTTSGTHPVSDFLTVSAAGSLSQYVALYFLAAAGCCIENDALVALPTDQ